MNASIPTTRGRLTPATVKAENSRGRRIWRAQVLDQWGVAWECDHGHLSSETALRCAREAVR